MKAEYTNARDRAYSATGAAMVLVAVCLAAHGSAWLSSWSVVPWTAGVAVLLHARRLRADRIVERT
jgi:hypothetical protein